MIFFTRIRAVEVRQAVCLHYFLCHGVRWAMCDVSLRGLFQITVRLVPISMMSFFPYPSTKQANLYLPKDKKVRTKHAYKTEHEPKSARAPSDS
jgi:hypothetical protein